MDSHVHDPAPPLPDEEGLHYLVFHCHLCYLSPLLLLCQGSRRRSTGCTAPQALLPVRSQNGRVVMLDVGWWMVQVEGRKRKEQKQGKGV